MSSLVVNLIIGFWLILFGALALFPLMLSDKQAPRVTASSTNKEDRVISIRPAIADAAGRPRVLHQPTSITADREGHDHDHEDHPLHAA